VKSRGRYVFDTNVLVSALLFRTSKPGEAFERAFLSGSVLISDKLLIELRDVLNRPKFDRYLSQAARVAFLADLNISGEKVVVNVSIQACRDPKDNHILELAISGGATCIISGDADLLALDPFQGIPIRMPDAFLAAHPPDQQP
jgi:uncharacterized protein